MTCKITKFQQKSANAYTKKKSFFLSLLISALKFQNIFFIHAVEEYLVKKTINVSDIRDLEIYLEGKLSEEDPNLTYFLANLYHRALVKARYDRAIDLYKKAIDLGCAEAVTDLGIMYLQGDSIPQDLKKARDYFEQAFAKGDSYAAYNLGVMYYDAPMQDYVLAKHWYEKSVAAGNPNSLFNLGKLYYDGEGVAKDLQRARDLYEKAAERGDVSAIYELGVMYANAEGCDQDLGACIN